MPMARALRILIWFLVTSHALGDDLLTTGVMPPYDVGSMGHSDYPMTTGTAANNSDGCCVSFVTTTPEMIRPALPPFMRGEGLLTEDDYIRLSQTVKMTVAPILLLGIITNTVSILVYLRMPASVTSTFFSLASGLDILYLLTLCPTTFMSLVVGQEQAVRSVFYIYYVTYVSNYVTYTTRKVIVCVTMLMSLDRYLIVAFPIRIRSLEHLRRPKSYTFLVTFLVYLFDINLAFKNKVVVTDQTVRIVPTENRLKNGQLFLDLALTSSIVFQYMPLALLVLFNALMVAALAKHSRNIRRRFGGPEKKTRQVSQRFHNAGMFDGQPTAGVGGCQSSNKDADDSGKKMEDARDDKQKAVTRTVLVYSCLFILLALPNTLYPLVRRFVPGLAAFGREHYLVMALGNVFALLDTISSAMNFFIYFITGSAFRAGVFRLFRTEQGRQPSASASQSSVLTTQEP